MLALHLLLLPPLLLLLIISPVRDLVLSLVAYKGAEKSSGDHGGLAVAEFVAAECTGGAAC
jgi:hypothetical protein